MAKRKVEVFTSGCFLCKETVKLVKDLACPNCEVTVYDLSEPCESKVCIDKAKAYGVNAIPAIAVNGELVECCERSRVDREALIAAGIGQ